MLLPRQQSLHRHTIRMLIYLYLLLINKAARFKPQTAADLVKYPNKLQIIRLNEIILMRKANPGYYAKACGIFQKKWSNNY